MKKKNPFKVFDLQERLKIGILCLFLVTMGLFTNLGSARAAALQVSDSVIFRQRQMTVEQISDVIMKQLKYDVFYSESTLDARRMVQLPASRMSLQDVLDYVLGDRFEYSLEGRAIRIRPKTETGSVETIRIRGVVTDTQKVPLPGVTVLIKGTTVGVTTDDKGSFVITLPNMQNIHLIFTFIGMKPQEIAYTGQHELQVIMEEDATEIEEVVVTGMFIRKAESFTGAAKTITAKELERVGNGNVFQSLRNLDPSLNIMDNLEFGSDPNRLPSMQLRGTSTFPIEGTSDLRSNYQDDPNQPLFILDGFEASATKIFDLDMNRVQSVTILKDAAAKAIYGSKAANGVVVIETKRPLGG